MTAATAQRCCTASRSLVPVAAIVQIGFRHRLKASIPAVVLAPRWAAASSFASASLNVVEWADPAIMSESWRRAGLGVIIEGFSRRPHAASAR
jgi:hypothetical protein